MPVTATMLNRSIILIIWKRVKCWTEQEVLYRKCNIQFGMCVNSISEWKSTPNSTTMMYASYYYYFIIHEHVKTLKKKQETIDWLLLKQTGIGTNDNGSKKNAKPLCIDDVDDSHTLIQENYTGSKNIHNLLHKTKQKRTNEYRLKFSMHFFLIFKVFIATAHRQWSAEQEMIFGTLE